MTERRERILDAARGLIVRDGYSSVSMNAIAQAAGVARPALYAEFSDREELFTRLVDREERRVLDMSAESGPELEPDADPVEVTERSTEIFVDLVLSAPETWRMVLMPSDGLPPAARERLERSRSAIRERTHGLLVLAAARAGRDIDSELLSHGVISASETSVRLLVAEPGFDRETVVSTLKWLLRRMIGVAGSSGTQRAGEA